MIFEIAHQIALLPVLALGWAILKNRIPRKEYALLTSAFFMSWVGDSLSTNPEQSVNWLYFWAPAQIIFAFASIIEKWNLRRVSINTAVCTFTLLLTQLNPETGVYLWTIGSIGLLALGRRSAVRIPLFIYFGLGTVMYLLMINSIPSPQVMNLWILYQSCRLAALVSLCILILRTKGGQSWKTFGLKYFRGSWH